MNSEEVYDSIDGFIIAYYTDRLPRMIAHNFKDIQTHVAISDDFKQRVAMKWVKRQLNLQKAAHFVDH